MSRSISISTDVFAGIWAKRRDGEDSEDAILRRILGCARSTKSLATPINLNENSGVHDTRNDVYFPRGFEIIRTYKRKEYQAVAQDGAWLRKDTGEKYPTLNQLNKSIAAGSENVWNGNWKYRTEGGILRSIDDLRN